MRRKQDIDPYPVGKIPPQAIDLEESILGAILMEKKAFVSVSTVLTPEKFYQPHNQVVYEACENLFNAGHPIDIATVTSELRKSGKLEAIGGAFRLMELTTKISSGANVEFYARVVVEKYIQREIIKTGANMMEKGFDDTVDGLSLLVESLATLEKLTGEQTRNEKTSLEVIKEVVKEISDHKDGKAKPGIKYGYTDVDDNAPDGMTGGDLIIVAGRPGMGKSAIATRIAINASIEQGKSGAFFNLEMKNTRTMRRMLSQHSGLYQKGIKDGSFLNDDRFNRTVAQLENAKIIFDEEAVLDKIKLRAKCLLYKQKYDIEYVVIDYLQLMDGTDKRMDAYARVSEISRGCKLLAKELDIPVILLSQLSREVEKRPDKKPMLSDLRDSGSIEQDADIVTFMYRPNYYKVNNIPLHDDPTYAEFIFAKFREGEPFTVPLKWQGDTMNFSDWNANHLQPRNFYEPTF